MEVLKTRKIRNNVFKQKCCQCSSVLKFTDADLGFEYNAWYFKCPVCKTEQWLNKKNELKRKIYHASSK